MSREVFDIASLVGDDESWTGESLYDDAARTRKYRKSAHYVRSQFSRSGVKATLLDLPICAIDGEGKSRANRRHDYCLFVAVWPTGRRHIEAPHLVTEQCLDFILDLPDDHVYLGYGLSYDTNMWLRDVPNTIVDFLLEKGYVRWKQYEIEWVERKYMTIRAYGKTRTVYDVLSFFQVPFVSPDPSIVKGACEAWLPELSGELDFVRFMKGLRGEFQNVPDADIERYTYLECELLERLMRKFIDALKAAEVRPNALYGPGAVAAAYLRKMGVKRYMRELDEPLAELSRRAYFGGRFDAAVFGWWEAVYQHDIKSAYPSVARYLPCLKCGQWTYHAAGFDGQLPAHGLYHVEWAIDPESRWGPFPHRTANGLIFYPYEGAGWYHADEVKAAIEFYGSDAVHVLEGYSLTSTCDHRPFGFIDSLYALRKHLESIGNYDQGIVIKLILNSLYGKLAQQVGRRGKTPPFQCFFWAGAITAGTRAQILRALAMDPDKVVSIATDGLVAIEALDFGDENIGEELGQWDIKKLISFAQLSNGVYHAVDEKGKTIDRARGLGRGVLDFEKGHALHKRWRATKGLGSFTYRGRTRFITHREARQSNDNDKRNATKCRWIEDEYRTIKFAPSRRFPWPDAAARKRDLLNTRLLSYVDYGAERESMPFRIKTTRGETEELRDKYQGTKWYDSA